MNKNAQNYGLTPSTIGNVGYGLDAVGNRLSRSGGSAQTLAYNTNDWLTNDAYDSNGNTLWTTNGGVATGPYAYDVENRLTNFGSISMVYNGDGLRASKTIGGTNTYYLMDDRNPSGYVQVLEEYQGTNLNRVYNK